MKSKVFLFQDIFSSLGLFSSNFVRSKLKSMKKSKSVNYPINNFYLYYCLSARSYKLYSWQYINRKNRHFYIPGFKKFLPLYLLLSLFGYKRTCSYLLKDETRITVFDEESLLYSTLTTILTRNSDWSNKDYNDHNGNKIGVIWKKKQNKK